MTSSQQQGNGDGRSTPPQNETTRNETPRNRSKLLPAILIGLGVLFLINNMGVLSWDIWAGLGALWPVILIAIGADILTGGRFRRLIVAAAIVVGAVVWFGDNSTQGALGSTAAAGNGELISQPLEGARRAQIRLEPGVAELHVSAGARGDTLIEGNVVAGRNQEVRQSFRRRGDLAEYTLDSRRTFWLPFSWLGGEGAREWDLRLNPAVPTDLRLDSGVGDVEMNLQGLDLTELTIDSGVGDVLMTLPEGSYSATIDAGVGDVTVRLPRNVAARIEADRGVGEVRVNGEYYTAGNAFESPNYGSARQRIDLRVDGGVGDITVQSY